MEFKEFDEYEEFNELDVLKTRKNIDLNEFARLVEVGELKIEDAIEKLNIKSLKEIATLKDKNNCDLLQIALKNNYSKLVSIILNGVKSIKQDRELVYGRRSASKAIDPSTDRVVDGDTYDERPYYSYTTSEETIDLFSDFDLFRLDGEGKNSIAYAITYNKDAFYQLITKSNDLRIKQLNLSSPTKGNNLDLINYLLRSLNGKSQPNLVASIQKLLKDPEQLNRISSFDLERLTEKLIIEPDNQQELQIIDCYLQIASQGQIDKLWRSIMTFYGPSTAVRGESIVGVLSRGGINSVERLLDLQERIMAKSVNISKNDLDLITKTKLSTNNSSEHTRVVDAMLRLTDLFDVSKDPKTIINKSPDVLKAYFGSDYENIVKTIVNSDVPSKEVLKKAIKCKWDKTRISMFSDLGPNMSSVSEDGHTLFNELTEEEIVNLFKYHNPKLSNEAVYDITDKEILSNGNIRSKNENLQSVENIYSAVYNYVPVENIEEFCNQMLLKFNVQNQFFHNVIDPLENFHESPDFRILNNKLEELYNGKYDGFKRIGDSYEEKLKKIKENDLESQNKKEDLTKQKEFYKSIEELIKENENLKRENDLLRKQLIANPQLSNDDSISK